MPLWGTTANEQEYNGQERSQHKDGIVRLIST
jgi:hypothetical protein